MNVTADLHVIKEQASFMAANVPKKTPQHVLTAVSIKAVEAKNGGLLIMEATDGQVHVRQAIDANVKESGGVFVDAQLLSGILSSFTGEGDVRLKLGKILSITKGKGQSRRLPPMHGEDFPEEPKPEFNVGWEQSAQSLLYQVGRVAFAAATDESQPLLKGINFNMVDGVLIGTDRKRMAYLESDFDKGELRPTFPARFIEEVERSRMGGTVSISVSDTWVRAISEDRQTVVWAISLAGNYPPEVAQMAKQLVEMDGVVFKFEKAAAVKTLHLAVMCAERSRQIEAGIHVVGEKGKIRFQMEIPDVAELKDVIPGEVDGTASVQVNPKYLLDAVTQVDADMVTLKIIEEKTSVVITDDNAKGWAVVQAGMHGGPSEQVVEEEEEEIDYGDL